MNGIKGFDKNLRCQGYQFELGKEHVHDGPVKLCSTGFHFVENPLDVFGYYAPSESRYAEITADGLSDETRDDSKRVAKSLKITAELSLQNLCRLGAKFILDKIDFANAKATNTGDRSAATNTGYQSAATNTGYRSAATNTGKEGCAVSIGIEGRAKGAVGCWLTLAEWSDRGGEWHRIDVQTRQVDGVAVKADTFYLLKGGKFVEVE